MPAVRRPAWGVLLLLCVGALGRGGAAIVVRGTTGVPPRLSTIWARTLPAIAEVGATYRLSAALAPAAVGGPDLLIMFCSTVEASNVRRAYICVGRALPLVCLTRALHGAGSS
jgi:hypothetical protein